MQRKGLLFLMLIGVLIGVFSAFQLTAQDEMDENDGELLVVFEAYLDAFAQDVEAFPDLLTEDAIRHHLRGPNMSDGELAEQWSRDEIAENALGFQGALPGVTFVVDDSVGRNDYLWTLFHSTELPDTDGQMIVGVLLARFEDGKIAEIWVADDQLAMLSLLGAFPMMEDMNE